MTLRWLNPEVCASQERLVQVGHGEAAIYIHRLLYRYFCDRPLRIEAAGFGAWRWLVIADDVAVLPELVYSEIG